MDRRRAWLFGMFVLACLGVVEMGASTLAAKPKKPKDQRVTTENPDGEDSIVGAVWEFAAVHPETGEKQAFRFRVAEGVCYNGIDDIVGTTRLKKKNVALLTFNEKSGRPGVYTVKLQRVGHWTGEQKIDDVKWALRLTCIDR